MKLCLWATLAQCCNRLLGSSLFSSGDRSSILSHTERFLLGLVDWWLVVSNSSLRSLLSLEVVFLCINFFSLLLFTDRSIRSYLLRVKCTVLRLRWIGTAIRSNVHGNLVASAVVLGICSNTSHQSIFGWTLHSSNTVVRFNSDMVSWHSHWLLHLLYRSIGSSWLLSRWDPSHTSYSSLLTQSEIDSVVDQSDDASETFVAVGLDNTKLTCVVFSKEFIFKLLKIEFELFWQLGWCQQESLDLL